MLERETTHSYTNKLSRSQVKQLIDAHTIIEVKRRLILENKQVQEMAYDFGFE